MKLRVDKRLNNGNTIPPIGLGVYKAGAGIGTISSVESALEAGYRLIDTAEIYGNEKEVGIALKNSGINRNEVFLTTKLWNENQSIDRVLNSFNSSLDKLNVDFIDLYLIHWPISNLRIPAYKQLELIYKSGRAKNIGVSNFTIRHLKELISETSIIPAINQVEFSPFLNQTELFDFCSSYNIILQAYTPLARMKYADSTILQNIGMKYKKTVAQIMLRWEIERGVIPIPKSSTKERIIENIDVFDFSLDTDDHTQLKTLNCGYRYSTDPESYL